MNNQYEVKPLPLPEGPWQTRAKCRGLVDEYDADNYPKDIMRDTTARRDLCRELCADCPVIRDCARTAIEPLAVGTIRAGIYIPLGGTDTLRRATVRLILAAIASGSCDPQTLEVDSKGRASTPDGPLLEAVA